MEGQPQDLDSALNILATVRADKDAFKADFDALQEAHVKLLADHDRTETRYISERSRREKAERALESFQRTVEARTAELDQLQAQLEDPAEREILRQTIVDEVQGRFLRKLQCLEDALAKEKTTAFQLRKELEVGENQTKDSLASLRAANDELREKLIADRDYYEAELKTAGRMASSKLELREKELKDCWQQNLALQAQLRSMAIEVRDVRSLSEKKESENLDRSRGLQDALKLAKEDHALLQGDLEAALRRAQLSEQLNVESRRLYEEALDVQSGLRKEKIKLEMEVRTLQAAVNGVKADAEVRLSEQARRLERLPEQLRADKDVLERKIDDLESVVSDLKAQGVEDEKNYRSALARKDNAHRDKLVALERQIAQLEQSRSEFENNLKTQRSAYESELKNYEEDLAFQRQKLHSVNNELEDVQAQLRKSEDEREAAESKISQLKTFEEQLLGMRSQHVQCTAELRSERRALETLREDNKQHQARAAELQSELAEQQKGRDSDSLSYREQINFLQHNATFLEEKVETMKQLAQRMKRQFTSRLNELTVENARLQREVDGGEQKREHVRHTMELELQSARRKIKDLHHRLDTFGSVIHSGEAPYRIPAVAGI
eukprot:Clim_evm9s56 gene=Clim_evmTU9s56